jgi:hypothetical protein
MNKMNTTARFYGLTPPSTGGRIGKEELLQKFKARIGQY